MTDKRIPEADPSAEKGTENDRLGPPSFVLDPSSAKRGNSSETEPGGFGKLARRIVGITSNGLFTAIVLVAGLGIGRQVLLWWSADSPRPTSGSKSLSEKGTWDDPANLQVMQFGGEGWTMARREFQGSSENAEKQLRLDCRSRLEKSTFSGQMPSPSPGRDALWALLKTSSPIEEDRPRWQLFASHRNIPLLVGVSPAILSITMEKEGGKKGTSASPPKYSGLREQNQEQPGIEGNPRLVLWGTALPQGEDRWAIWIFTPSSTKRDARDRLSEIPLPPKCRKILTIQAEDRGGVISFSGFEDSGNWKGHFANWFTRNGWQTIGDESTPGKAWFLRFQNDCDGKRQEAAVYARSDESGEAVGFLTLEGESIPSEGTPSR